MSLKSNALVALIEESIALKDSAQSILSGAIEDTSLSRLERLVLMTTVESDRALTAAQVGRILGHSRQAVKLATARLLDLEFIRKTPNPEHKTASLLEPTPKGIKFEAQVAATLEEIVSSIFSDKNLRKCERMTRDMRNLKTLIETSQSRRTRNRG